MPIARGSAYVGGPNDIEQDEKSARWVELVALFSVGFAAFHMREVLVPVAFALLAVLAVHPLYERLRLRIGRAPAAGVCFVVVAAVVALLFTLITVCFLEVKDYVDQHASSGSIESGIEHFRKQLPDVIAPSVKSLQEGGWANGAFEPTLRLGLHSSVGVVLALAFFLLALLDAQRLRHRVRQNGRWKWFGEATVETATNVRRYLLARTVVGLLTGVAVSVGCWAVGVELFIVWGALNFLLNYIPTLGSILGVFPPALFVWITTGSGAEVLLVLGIVGGVQLVMGNYVDPLIQSRFVELSPFGVLLSVVFWGWLWGIAGAFIGVPMTVGLLMCCKRFDSHRWIHTALVTNARSST